MEPLPASADVIVVGGGVVGLAIALALAATGVRPLLLEAKAIGGAVTGGSLAAIGAHMHGLAEFALMRHACDLWQDFARQTGNPFDYNRQGLLGFIAEPEDLITGETWVAAERALGAECRMLTPAEIPAIEPALTGRLAGATFAPDTATVNPFLAARALRAAACAAGAEVRDHLPVAAVLTAAGKVAGVRLASGAEIAATKVVIAAGPWTADLAATVGVALPLVPRQAQCLATLRQPRGTIRRVISAVEAKGGVAGGYTQIQQSASGQILFNTVVAPTETPPEAKDTIREVPPGFVVDSIDTLTRLFPALAGVELLRSWVRFEAVSPDARFLAGPVGPEGLWICAGDNGSGYCRALMLGRFLAGEMAGHGGLDPSHATEARALYDPARFERGAV